MGLVVRIQVATVLICAGSENLIKNEALETYRFLSSKTQKPPR